MTALSIRLLEPDSQQRGDLFGRLMTDLFHVLGYHEFVLNIPKSGREIDLRAQHRTENHGALAECKATADKIGGADLNKFVGVLDVERRRRNGESLEGYFISLNGFSPSALAQESEAGDHRLVLLAGDAVVRELIAGKIVVAPATAAAAAGKCIGSKRSFNVSPQIELLAHDTGWFWCVTFSKAGVGVAFVLVHADGTPLGMKAATPLILADSATGGWLESLEFIAAESDPHDHGSIESARSAYRAFLAHEYGRITVDGLPADEHIESKSIALGDLFVPMHLQSEPRLRQPAPPGETDEDAAPGSPPMFADSASIEAQPTAPRRSVGSVLAAERRVAVLGAPGSGKSTLLKRLAVAYGIQDRRTEIADDLPERPWVPFVIRCRQLDDLAGRPLRDVLQSIPNKGEFSEHAGGFCSLTDSSLRDGTALVLVDGLDEITDPQQRLSFVKQLRTFVGTYPTAQLVVTSREAGFRLVAGALGDVTTRYRVADFNDDDITSLAIAWTLLVKGDSPAARAEGKVIADTILQADRVRRLARNPLLLTTLLLVMRWVGNLPKKRTALYAKAIEVLLMTWNIEGHKPIDLDEAIPQLAYVAFAMTCAKAQSLSRQGIIDLLERARLDMPEVLGQTDIPPGQFLERVEERSSLLSLSGHGLEDGIVTPLYEFKHLTFQEYLTAVAIASEYYPERDPDDTPEKVLAPRLAEQQWLEVIPMVTVLVGRRAAPIVKYLISLLESRDPSRITIEAATHYAFITLAQCLADEVQIPPELVADATRALAASGESSVAVELHGILAGKYRKIFCDELADQFRAMRGEYHRFGSFLGSAAVLSHLVSDGQRLRDDWESSLADVFALPDAARGGGEGALMVVRLAFEAGIGSGLELENVKQLSRRQIRRLEILIRPVLRSDDAAARYAAAWAYAWLGRLEFDSRYVSKVTPTLYSLWRAARQTAVRDMMAWAIASLPVLPVSAVRLPKLTQDDIRFLERELRVRTPKLRREGPAAALVAGYYLGGPWTGGVLREHVEELRYEPARTRLLERLPLR